MVGRGLAPRASADRAHAAGQEARGGWAGWAAGRADTLGWVAVAIAADWLVGEPPAACHPVAGFGRSMQLLEAKWYADSRLRGAAFTAAGIGVAATAGASLSLLRGPARRGAGLALASYVAVAGRALAAAANGVASALEAGDLPAARARLPALVGRDPAGLDESEIVRAVVESVAENTVDAVVAAALWAAVGGAPAVLAYRAINTLDAMVGHRSSRYARFGWATARADDLAGWIPARATALLVACVRPAAAGDVWVAVHSQAGVHPSPNAGVAEAAFAAALGIRLGGRNVYDGRAEIRPTLGAGRSPVTPDIVRAVRLSRHVTAALALLAGAAALARAGARTGSRPPWSRR